MSIAFEIRLVLDIAHTGKDSTPSSASFVFCLNFLEDELVNDSLAASFVLDVEIMAALEFGMPAVEVSLDEGRHSCQCEQVCDHVALNLEIQTAVGVHRGRVVDFDQPGLEVGVDHDIES